MQVTPAALVDELITRYYRRRMLARYGKPVTLLVATLLVMLVCLLVAHSLHLDDLSPKSARAEGIKSLVVIGWMMLIPLGYAVALIICAGTSPFWYKKLDDPVFFKMIELLPDELTRDIRLKQQAGVELVNRDADVFLARARHEYGRKKSGAAACDINATRRSRGR